MGSPLATYWSISAPLSAANTTPVVTQSQVDRKSTRLNSSHLGISYAVFCLKLRSRSEEHTSELQSLRHLVCRVLLENTVTLVHLGAEGRRPSRRGFCGLMGRV